MCLDSFVPMVVLFGNDFRMIYNDACVPVAPGDAIHAQVVEHRLAMDQPEAGAAQRRHLRGRAGFRGNVPHQPHVLGLPVMVEPCVIDKALRSEPLRGVPFAGDVCNARFRLFHEPRASDSRVPHDSSPYRHRDRSCRRPSHGAANVYRPRVTIQRP